MNLVNNEQRDAVSQNRCLVADVNSVGGQARGHKVFPFSPDPSRKSHFSGCLSFDRPGVTRNLFCLFVNTSQTLGVFWDGEILREGSSSRSYLISWLWSGWRCNFVLWNISETVEKLEKESYLEENFSCVIFLLSRQQLSEFRWSVHFILLKYLEGGEIGKAGKFKDIISSECSGAWLYLAGCNLIGKLRVITRKRKDNYDRYIIPG